VLYLGRIHPIKGISNLLHAWRAVAPKFGDWQLRLVGPDDGGHLVQMQRLAHDLELPRVAFAGPRYGTEKNAEYSGADLYVFPSHSENFGMSVAEALAHGVPVVTTTGTPWEKVEEHGCGWLVPPTAAGIQRALNEAISLDRPSLGKMGQAGRAWMQREFSWSRVAQDIESAYRWILGGGSPPNFVRLD
jgi:glycosyltransferase involved in cell wall biosynthesis